MIRQAGLDITWRDSERQWNSVLEGFDYQPVAYQYSSIKYELAYLAGRGGQWDDLSCVLSLGGKPVALWPLTVSFLDNRFDVSSQGRPLLPPLFIKSLTEKSRRKITKKCLAFLNRLVVNHGLTHLKTTDPFTPQGQLSNWHLLQMNTGAQCSVQHELVVDLTRTLAQIKASFRKSYKSLISAGARYWDINVLGSSIEKSTWAEFQDLHRKVAGRSTRSNESWNIQYEMLIKNEAFLVTLRNPAGGLVGAGFFMHTKSEGVYAVAAYDRSLFDKPLGHAVQFVAIEEMKRRGCQFYRIGRRPYSGENISVTQKELAIAYFKEGFATGVYPVFTLEKSFSPTSFHAN
jgi:FemAB family protein